MIVGDVVVPKSAHFVLRSSAQSYTHAIVGCVEPFTLGSEDADMRWSATVKPSDFKVIGAAKDGTMSRILDRLKRDAGVAGSA